MGQRKEIAIRRAPALLHLTNRRGKHGSSGVLVAEESSWQRMRSRLKRGQRERTNLIRFVHEFFRLRRLARRMLLINVLALDVRSPCDSKVEKSLPREDPNFGPN